MRGKRFQVFLVKAHAADRHSAAGFVVDQDRKRYSELPRKFVCGPSIVLGDPEKGYAIAAITFVEAFEERECELADGAGHLEECSDDRAAFQKADERVFLVIASFQRKSWSRVSSNDVRHVVLYSHPALNQPQNSHRQSVS